jgi:hypothetical protein
VVPDRLVGVAGWGFGRREDATVATGQRDVGGCRATEGEHERAVRLLTATQARRVRGASMRDVTQ